jgi:zinc protease
MSQNNVSALTTAGHGMPGPHDITRVVLDNGLTVLVRENHTAPVVVIDGYIRAGSVLDPDEKAGLAAFVASMCTRGSAAYDFDAFNELVEGLGAGVALSADDHVTSFGANSLSEDFPTLLAVLADVVRHPTFPVEHMARVRTQKLVQIQERDQDTASVAAMAFYHGLYPNHPYGRLTSGYAHTIGAISHQDLLDFHSRHYKPDGAILVIVGDVDTAAALDAVRRHFGDWQGTRPDHPLAPPTLASHYTPVTQTLPDKIQADIVLGCRTVPRHHPDYFAIRLANTILGRFGLNGRLGEVVREEQGLAYYVYSSQEAGEQAGVWMAAAGVNPEDVEQAIASILEEFARLCDEPVSEEELSDSQAYLTGVLPLMLETNEGVASTLLNMEYYSLGLDYLHRYTGLVEAVSAADVQRVAQTYLRPEAIMLAVAAPEPEVA